MLIKLVLAFFGLLTLMALANTEALFRDQPRAQRRAALPREDLRGFALAADRFVRAHPEFEGALSWAGEPGTTALRAQPSTPEGLRGHAMSPDWRVVVPAGEDWVLCARLRPETAALVAARMGPNARGVPFGAGGSPDYVVFDQPAQAEARMRW